MTEKACKNCRFVSEEMTTCPVCGGTSVTEKFSGVIFIFDSEKSQFAKIIGAKVPGKYAMKVK